VEICESCGDVVSDVYICNDCGNSVCWNCFEDGFCCDLAEADALLFAGV